MALIRDFLLGPPHRYYVTARLAADANLFSDPALAEIFFDLLNSLRAAFDVRLLSVRLQPNRYLLVLSHPSRVTDTDDTIRKRWATLGGRSMPNVERLRERLSSLSGFMQTLAQRASRRIRAHTGGRGTLWAERYRACLLADDAAALAAMSWVDRCEGIAGPDHLLTPAPVRALPGEEVLPADEAPLGLPPPTADHAHFLYARFMTEIAEEDLTMYDHALNHGWCLGRPESLTEALSRLGREAGRGRSRQLRDLDDQLGLCGVWG